MRCRIHQWRLSKSLGAAGGELPGGLRRHLERCGPCRLYRDRLTALEADLRDDAPDAPPLRAELKDRILAAVAAESPPAPVPARRPRPGPGRLVIRIAVGSAAAAACLTAAIVLHEVLSPVRPRHPDPGIVKSDANGPPSLPLLAVADELPRMLIDDVDQLVAPVTDEMRRMADQTRRLGSSLLAQLPLGLIDDALPERPPRDKPATTSPARPSSG